MVYNSLKKVAVFDFDKTIVSVDSFRLFSLLVSRGLFEYGIAVLSALACACRLIDNATYKRIILRAVWRRRTDQEKRAALLRLHVELNASLNAAVVAALEGHLKSNEPVLVVTASPEFYVEPFIRGLWRSVAVCASKVDGDGDVLLARNMYATNKVEHVQEFIRTNNATRVAVYTDSIADLPIVNLANEVKLVDPSRRFQRRLRQLEKKFEVIR